MRMRFLLIAIACVISVGASAQTCPYAPVGQTSGVVPVSQTITIGLNYGDMIDCSTFQFVAMAAVNPMFSLVSPDSEAVIKFGVVDGGGIAYNLIDLSNFTISTLEVAALQNGTGNGVDAYDGTFAVFDNTIRIGVIRNMGGNGFLALDQSNNAIYNFQGNHVEIGQVFNVGGSGVAIFPGAYANTFIIGPVEHNAVYGCYDAASGAVPANLQNIWIVNGANSNGVAKGANPNAVC
jgi:hypothetical protein